MLPVKLRRLLRSRLLLPFEDEHSDNEHHQTNERRQRDDYRQRSR